MSHVGAGCRDVPYRVGAFVHSRARVLPLLDDPKGVRFDPVMNVLRALCIGVVNGLLWALVIIFGRYALRFGLMLLL